MLRARRGLSNSPIVVPLPPCSLGGFFIQEDMTIGIPVFRSVVDQNRSFVITTHVNPDGDGIGSELALQNFLLKLGKRPVVMNHSATPANYRWLDQNNSIIQFSPDRDGRIVLDADVILIIDANQPSRLRSMEPFVLQSKAVKTIIDHHLDAHPFAQHQILDKEATSTGEIIYGLISSIGPELIDRDIARALYTAIMTDTGSFRYPRTDASIHRIAAHLIERGADPTDIFSAVYESWSPGW